MDHDDWDGPDGLDPADPDADASPAPTPVERTGPRPLTHASRASARRRVATVAAVVATLVIGTVAFGAELGIVGHRGDDEDQPTEPPTAVVEPTHKPAATEAPDGAEDAGAVDSTDETDGPDVIKPTEQPAPTATDKPEPKPTEQPEPTKKPEPKATPKPEPKPTEPPKPEVKALEIAVMIKEGHVVVAWSACGVDSAEAYKVVRSSDSTVRWPLGDGDELIAVVGMDGTRKVWDEHAPAGKKASYRVFCVRHGDDGYRVLAKTPVGSIVAPEATPKPTPKPTPEVTSLWLEASADEGAIVLSWETCERDAFSHYRIVRKVDGEGSVIAEIEDAGTTTYRDESVEPGVTYHYLVQCKGHAGDDWFLLGTSDWVAASID